MVQGNPSLNQHRPLVSVCIANFNGEALLASCLESVFQQEGPFEIEVIVHDDASDDGSVVLLEERYPRVALLKSAENVGFCIANNRMAEKASGEFLLLLNNDAALHPGAIDALLRFSVTQVTPGILTLPQFDWETGQLVDLGCLLDPFYNPIPNLDCTRDEVAYVIGACLWIPASHWRELGGFPVWMESIGEDVYLACLSRYFGRSVHVAPGSGYRHRQGSSFGGNRLAEGRLSTTVRRRTLSERNKTCILSIFTPAPFRLPLLMLHAVFMVAESVAVAIAWRDAGKARSIYLSAITVLWRDRVRLGDTRLAVQKRRRISRLAYFKTFRLFPRKLSLLFRFGIPEIRP